MTPEEQNKALDAWEISARHWDKHRALIAQMFAPLTSGLVEEARIGMGQKVLDIGAENCRGHRTTRRTRFSRTQAICGWQRILARVRALSRDASATTTAKLLSAKDHAGFYVDEVLFHHDHKQRPDIPCLGFRAGHMIETHEPAGEFKEW